jgi:hypothetical protein
MSGGEYKVVGNERNVTVSYIVGGWPVGITNADNAGLLMPSDSFPPGRWWLARINVLEHLAPGVTRGQGIGSEMMRLLQERLVIIPSFQELLVAPGGYGADEKKQWNFYLKHGFAPLGSALVWRKPS